MTYHWKSLDEGYNFVSDLITIEGLHEKLWAPKVAGILTLGISGLSFGSLGQKAIWMWPPWRGAEYIIRGEGGGESCEFELHVARLSTKSAPTMH